MKIRAAILLLFLLAFSAIPARAATSGSALLTPVEPASCPTAGCAPGQRLSYYLQFTLDSGVLKSGPDPNVKVCVYIPSSWQASNSIQLDSIGGVTGANYDSTVPCADAGMVPPTGFALLVAGSANLDPNSAIDTLNLSFRISPAGTGGGFLLMRVFALNSSDTWVKSSEYFTPSRISLAARSASVYVASDPSACSASPCFLNSSGDFANGLGTGLKDAVDALDVTQPNLKVTVLGTVALKGNPVLIDKSISLAGSGSGAALTVQTGSTCSAANPLLILTAGGSVQNLALSDGSCSSTTDRPLIKIKSTDPVSILSNTLSGGADAIQVGDSSGDNLGAVTVRYNQITGNSGYGLKWTDVAGSTSTVKLDLTANNIFSNRSGVQVDCAVGTSSAHPSRFAEHNYWGSASAPSQNDTHCTLTGGKQLGAAVAASTDGSGVDAIADTATTDWKYAFDSQISYQRSGGDPVPLVIVNHGSASPDGVPFPGTYSMLNPCSNAWDVFLEDSVDAAALAGKLSLSFSYNRSAACLAAVEMTTFCSQTASPQNYPLWWYDPRGQATAGWDTTGQKPAGSKPDATKGQTTSCDKTTHRIQVDIDNDSAKRPILAKDLAFLPLLAGIPVTNTFIGLASSQTATLQWTTISEPDVSGFVVLRSLVGSTGPFDPISDLIARKGSATFGSSYFYYDTGRTNGTALWYRIKLVRTDGNAVYSDVVKVIPDTPTSTPTFTPFPTLTPYPTFTPFRLPTTAVPATRIATATAIRFASPTARTATPKPGTVYPTDTFAPGGTVTPTTSGGGYPAPEESGTPATPDLTQTAGTPQDTQITLTPSITPTASRTAAPTLSRGEQIRGASKYISMLLGLLLGGGLVFGVAWAVFRRKRL